MLTSVSYTDVINYFRPGTVLWRGCHTFERGVIIRDYTEADMPLADSEKFVLCRIHAGGNGVPIYEPVVAGDQEQGIVCFLNKRPPRDWTHLVVTGMANSGRALFAVHVGSLSLEEYKDFRHQYYETIRDNHGRLEPIFVARSQKVSLPPELHRGYFRHQGEGVWDVECPLRCPCASKRSQEQRLIGSGAVL